MFLLVIFFMNNISHLSLRSTNAKHIANLIAENFAQTKSTQSESKKKKI